MSNNRRTFLKNAALGGLAAGGLAGLSFEDRVAVTTGGVSRASAPSDLKITDMRYAVFQNVGRTAIIRIDTNQGIYGLGEVRDGADERYALMLKSRILGQNPRNVEMIFKMIRQFGGPLHRYRSRTRDLKNWSRSSTMSAVLRGRHAELPCARTSFDRCALVGKPREDDGWPGVDHEGICQCPAGGTRSWHRTQ